MSGPPGGRDQPWESLVITGGSGDTLCLARITWIERWPHLEECLPSEWIGQ